MREIIIKVVGGSEELVGTTLRLERIQNSKNYICKETGIEIIDEWNELDSLRNQLVKNSFTLKYDVLLFVNSSVKNPLFINTIQRSKIQVDLNRQNSKQFSFLLKFWRFRNTKLVLTR